MWTLVTGGAKRLGAALCLALAEKGYSIVVHYNRSHTEALAIVERCEAMGAKAAMIQGDFSTEANLQDFVVRYLVEFPETFNIINNVGEYLIRSALQTSLKEWQSLFHVNLHTPFFLVKSLQSSLVQHKGQVINIGISGLLRHSANTYATAYMITKESLWTLTRCLARELASDGVRVNMVSPGELDISIDHHRLPMNRPATCEEIARVVCFLLDPASSYITGQNIEVAGGLGLA